MIIKIEKGSSVPVITHGSNKFRFKTEESFLDFFSAFIRGFFEKNGPSSDISIYTRIKSDASKSVQG